MNLILAFAIVLATAASDSQIIKTYHCKPPYDDEEESIGGLDWTLEVERIDDQLVFNLQSREAGPTAHRKLEASLRIAGNSTSKYEDSQNGYLAVIPMETEAGKNRDFPERIKIEHLKNRSRQECYLPK